VNFETHYHQLFSLLLPLAETEQKQIKDNKIYEDAAVWLLYYSETVEKGYLARG
jgi:hypothetical protein